MVVVFVVWFTAGDWEAFESDQKHRAQKIGRMVERLVALGFVNPSEVAVRHLAAAIASSHCPDADGGVLFNIVRDIKSAMVTARKTGATMKVLPNSPDVLPAVDYAAAYPDEPPITKHIDGFP